MPFTPPPGVVLTPVTSGQNVIKAHGDFCALLIATSGTPYSSGAPFNLPNPNTWFYNTQSSGGAVVIGFGGDPTHNTGPKLLFGVLETNNPFDIGGRCFFWSDPSNGSTLLDQNRLRLDGDGQLTIRTANTQVSSVADSLLLVHVPLSGLVSLPGIGMGIQVRTTDNSGGGQNLGFINFVASDVTSGNFTSHIDFYNTQPTNPGGLALQLQGDGTVYIPGANSVVRKSTLSGLSLAQRTTQVSTTLSISGDYYLWVNASISGVIISLPTAVGNPGQTFVVKLVSSTNSATVMANGSEKIDGQSSILINTQYQSFTFVSDNIGWNLT